MLNNKEEANIVLMTFASLEGGGTVDDITSEVIRQARIGGVSEDRISFGEVRRIVSKVQSLNEVLIR